MAEQSLVSSAPNVAYRLPQAVGEKRTTAEPKTEANKTSAAKGGSKQQKLYIHLFIGFLMTLVVIAGYAFFGPASQVNAVEAVANQVVNIANSEPAAFTYDQPMVDYGQSNDLAAMQAEMDAIMRQMETLQTWNSYYVANGNSSAINAAQVQQMTTQMNNLVGRTNSVYNPSNSISAQASGAGGVHNH